jgi:alkylation response protein AidB-like acyl-CoA dehydrogenase
MLWELTSDQEFFRQTTAKFLADQVPVDVLRRLRDDATGFPERYWERGAELGWTSLLVDESHGGGTISGEGIVDLTVIAYEFGSHAAPGPLATNNIVAGALSATGSCPDALESISAGTQLASWCLEEPGFRASVTDVALDIGTDGSDVVISGSKQPVESADRCSHLLVTGRTGSGVTQVLVPADAPGVEVTPLKNVDLTRRFSAVRFDHVRVPRDRVVGEIAGAAEQVERQFQLAALLAAVESVGAMQTVFDMTVQWAFDRYSFGRPLASYQALKHRFADMLTWLQTGHALSDSAAAAVQAGRDDAAELVSAAKAYIGHYGAELMHDCVQMHGGIGVTFEHDIHLYLRRLTLNRSLHGTPAQHRQRITDALEQAKDAA